VTQNRKRKSTPKVSQETNIVLNERVQKLHKVKKIG
jgi:hypothetical protein